MLACAWVEVRLSTGPLARCKYGAVEPGDGGGGADVRQSTIHPLGSIGFNLVATAAVAEPDGEKPAPATLLPGASTVQSSAACPMRRKEESLAAAQADEVTGRDTAAAATAVG